MAEKSKYESPDYGLEDCDVLFKGEDKMALILTKAIGKGQSSDCLIIARFDKYKKCYLDNDTNWMNIKRKSFPTIRKK